MDMTTFNRLQDKTSFKGEKEYIHKGLRILPDLKTAILANLKGFVNGFYPEPLFGLAKEIGYYPLSMASEKELEQIQIIENKIIGGAK